MQSVVTPVGARPPAASARLTQDIQAEWLRELALTTAAPRASRRRLIGRHRGQPVILIRAAG